MTSTARFCLRLSRNFLIVIFSVSSVLLPRAQAQFHVGPIAAATGEAGRAAIDPGEISVLNPAAVAFLQRYYAGFDGSLLNHEELGRQDQWGALLADNSKDGFFAGALSYQRRETRFDDGTHSLDQDIQGTVGGFIRRNLAIGASVHRLYDMSTGPSSAPQTNAQFGVLWAVTEYLGLALTAFDVLPTGGADVAPALRLIPTYAFGSNWIIQEMLHVRFDVSRPTEFNPGGRTNVMAGLESFLRPEVAARFGANMQETENQTWLSAGLGVHGPRLSMDYTFEKDIRVGRGTRHLFDLWLPF